MESGATPRSSVPVASSPDVIVKYDLEWNQRSETTTRRGKNEYKAVIAFWKKMDNEQNKEIMPNDTFSAIACFSL